MLAQQQRTAAAVLFGLRSVAGASGGLAGDAILGNQGLQLASVEHLANDVAAKSDRWEP